ncbi:hypothetical protein D3C81_803810 [compost metagenome]
MLRGATVIGAQLAVAFTLNEALRFDQEQMRFSALAGGPDFQELALFTQLRQFVFGEIGGMADPDVHVALFGLGEGAQATHQVKPMDGLRRVAAASLVGK